MFKLKESDYKALYPMAKRLFRDKYNTPYLSESFRTGIGQRALVEMLFLEDGDDSTFDPFDYTEEISSILNKIANKTITEKEGKELLRNITKKMKPSSNNVNVSDEKSFFINLWKRIKKIFAPITNIHKSTMNSNRKGLLGVLASIYQYAFTHPVKFIVLAGITAIFLAFLVSPKLRNKVLTFARNIFKTTPDEAKSALNSAVGNVG